MPANTLVAFDLESLDGMEIRPGITLIGMPTWHEKEWRSLANVYGQLAIVALQIRIIGGKSDAS